jgi:transposase InsO family protein
MRRLRNSKKPSNLEDQIFCRYGAPARLGIDTGCQFTSKMLQRLCKQWVIEHRLTSPYHAQQNMTERSNQTLRQMIQAFVDDHHGTWDKHLQKFPLAMRTSINETTQISPALLNLGREISTPFECAIGSDTINDIQQQRDERLEIPPKLKLVND